MVSMTTLTVDEAEANFSQLVSRAEAGETITVARNGHPVALIAPPSSRERGVVFGSMKGKIHVSDDFDEWTEADERDWFGE